MPSAVVSGTMFAYFFGIGKVGKEQLIFYFAKELRFAFISLFSLYHFLSMGAR